MPTNYTVQCNPGLTVFFLPKEDEAKTKCSEIINLLLIARIFPHPCGARKNTTQLQKYPCVLSTKTVNKVYGSVCITPLRAKINIHVLLKVLHIFLWNQSGEFV